MAKTFRLLPLLSLWLFWSCSQPSENALENAPGYFPMKEYFEVEAGKIQGVKLAKEVAINGKKEYSEQELNGAEWVKEFEFFIQADINKPTLSSAYDTKRSAEYLIHELKEGEKGKVKKIVVRYQGDIIRSISFHTKTENIFYSSEIRGTVFNTVDGIFDHYTIESFQEIPFMKPNKMIVHGALKPL